MEAPWCYRCDSWPCRCVVDEVKDMPASTLAGQIRVISRGRAMGAIAAMMAAGRGGILGQVNDAPVVTEPPVVEQMRSVRFTRRPPVDRKKALEELPPAQRWRVDGTPFRGKRQIERQQRQAERAALKRSPKWVETDGVLAAAALEARKVGYDPVSKTHYSGSALIPDVTDADIANAGGPRKNDGPDLMACPRCNQYNQRTNYACRVCGFEFGIST